MDCVLDVLVSHPGLDRPGIMVRRWQAHSRNAIAPTIRRGRPTRGRCSAASRSRWRRALGLELLDLGLINRRLPAPVHARRLGLGDTLKLALAPQVGLELGEDAQHVEEALAGGRAGVDRLLGRP